MQVQNVLSYSIGNSLVPEEGPQAFSLMLNYGLLPSDGFQIDQLSLPQVAQRCSMVQSVYIDASRTDASVVVTVGKSGQQIIAKGRTQGYYPVVAPNNWYFDIQCSDVAAQIGITLCNYQVAPGTWAAVHP